MWLISFVTVLLYVICKINRLHFEVLGRALIIGVRLQPRDLILLEMSCSNRLRYVAGRFSLLTRRKFSCRTTKIERGNFSKVRTVARVSTGS